MNLSGQSCIESLGQQQKISIINNDLYFATVVSDILRVVTLDTSGTFLNLFHISCLLMLTDKIPETLQDQKNIYQFDVSLPKIGTLQSLKSLDGKLLVVLDTGIYTLSLASIKRARQKVDIQKSQEKKCGHYVLPGYSELGGLEPVYTSELKNFVNADINFQFGQNFTTVVTSQAEGCQVFLIGPTGTRQLAHEAITGARLCLTATTKTSVFPLTAFISGNKLLRPNWKERSEIMCPSLKPSNDCLSDTKCQKCSCITQGMSNSITCSLIEGQCSETIRIPNKYTEKCGMAGRRNKEFCFVKAGQRPTCSLPFAPGYQLENYAIKTTLKANDVLGKWSVRSGTTDLQDSLIHRLL